MSSSQANNAASAPSHNQLDTKAQAWSALFSEPMSDLVKRYTSSVFFDKRLWQADIAGSLAHAEMLAAQGVISAEDHASIQRGMAQITQEIESGAFEWIVSPSVLSLSHMSSPQLGLTPSKTISASGKSCLNSG